MIRVIYFCPSSSWVAAKKFTEGFGLAPSHQNPVGTFPFIVKKVAEESNCLLLKRGFSKSLFKAKSLRQGMRNTLI